MFAPNYIENKLKFFPHIKEAVAFGNGRDRVCAFVNIDMGSVGNWAERRGLAYSGYTDLARKPEVVRRWCASASRRSTPSSPREGDARRLADPPLPDPAQGARPGRRRAHAHAQGAPRLRRGEVRGADRRAVRRPRRRSTSRRWCASRTAAAAWSRADLVIEDAQTSRRDAAGRMSASTRSDAHGGRRASRAAERRMSSRRAAPRGRGRSCELDNISLAFGGVKALHRHQLRRARARDPRDHRPQRRGQELDAQRDQRRLPPAAGHDHLPRRGAPRHGHRTTPRSSGIARTFQNIALFRGMTVLDNIMTGRNLRMKATFLAAGAVARPRAARGAREPPQGRGDHRLPRDPAHPQDAGGPPALRPAEARRARRARSPPSRRCCCSTSRWPA